MIRIAVIDILGIWYLHLVRIDTEIIADALQTQTQYYKSAIETFI